MCGIAGIWSRNLKDSNRISLQHMTDSLTHRGPDGEGHWMSNDAHVLLGHRRLAIIDLSKDGQQPMSFLERYTITFNGEIYNYIELRAELLKKGYAFQSATDTEVILKAYHAWGKDCLQHFDGMFAFAIFDSLNNELFCARDRFGEKPFYYAIHEGNFVFASEMKALWKYGIDKSLNDCMMYQFLVNDLVENPNKPTETFYKGIFKLQASHYFMYIGNGEVKQRKYWDIDVSTHSKPSQKELNTRYSEILSKSVERRLRSDVPVGTSLSGGLDSSTIVALMNGLIDKTHTFSARFKDSPKDEGKFIKIVTDYFNTTHHDVFVDENMFIDAFEKLCYHQEEPFQTGSIFAQYCVYEKARKENILVMLDGQGADEFMCGYDKDYNVYLKQVYFQPKHYKQVKNLLASNINHTSDISCLEALSFQFPQTKKHLRTLKNSMLAMVPLGVNPNFHAATFEKESPFFEFKTLKETLKHEMLHQGLEKLLRFADRNSMAHSLEVRLPFLSHELVEFVFQLDDSYFLQNGWSKAILRNAIEGILPNEIVRRKDKIGFDAPHQVWMKNKYLQNLHDDAKQNLFKKGIITNDYSNAWKIIIANKFIESQK
jgi:asparagine synthase (glutamine-hydrolysing)